jgi:hypothetical protein
VQAHVVVAVAALLASACGGQAPAPKRAPLAASTQRAPASPSASNQTAPTQAAKPKAPAAPAAAAAPASSTPAALEDLLHVTEAVVHVSSSVENTRNFPEHLVDEDIATAWQSLSGDLSPTIRVQLPAGVEVDHIELTAGYTKSVGNQDAFTQNHRITELSVKRDGQELGRFTLDPMQRNLQSIPIHTGGGSYEIKVTRALPGTRPEWREIAVSELRVMGRAGAARKAPAQPPIEVGAHDPEEVRTLNASITAEEIKTAQTSIAALCAANIAAPATVTTEEGTVLKPKGRAKCAPLAAGFALPKSTTYLGLSSVKTFNGFGDSIEYVLRVQRGYVSLPLSLGVESDEDPGCPGIVRPDKIDSIRIENGYLVIDLSAPYESYVEDEHARPIKNLRTWGGALWCKEDNAALSCRQYTPKSGDGFSRFRITADGLLHPSE